jgi:uroporphyrinogen-III synthase/uroporphyrinogen III methyltransferase/synthase
MTVVLNTRPKDQASELSRLLRAARFDVVEAPAIATVAAWDRSTFDQARADVQRGAFDWVVLPSQNAGRGLEAELRARGERVLCGAATAGALGLDTARTLDRFNGATALLALRPHLRAGQRVLVPRAAEGREELVEGLRALNVEVVAPVAYRTVPIGDAAARLGHGDVDVVALCSPSAVASVAASVDADTLVICLGETTAEAARSRGLRVHSVAARPTMSALVETIEAALGARV